jgi:hypothetical protein
MTGTKLVADGVDAPSAGGPQETEEETRKPARKRKPRKKPIPPAQALEAQAYVKNLKRLGLTPWIGAPHLGISPGMSLRYAAGTHAIPAPVAKLLRALVLLKRTDV